jgi:hypothetical protein
MVSAQPLISKAWEKKETGNAIYQGSAAYRSMWENLAMILVKGSTKTEHR